MKGTIIYYGGFALPDKNAAANRVVSNGKLFDSLGYSTIFLGACYDAEISGMWQVSENMFEEMHPVTSAEWIKQILSFSNLKKLAEECKNLKMVLLYNVPFITLVLVKKYFSEKGVLVVYDCTEWTQHTEGSFLKKAFKFVDEYFIRKSTHKIADKMIVISDFMERAYERNEKILKLPPLVDICDEIWHQATQEKNDEFTFCFAGFPDGNKDSLDKVVEAFQRIDRDDIKLNTVGITRGEFNSLYPQVEIKRQSEKQICFLGKKTHKETIKEVLNCDCYIFIRPSDRRNNAGFPTKFVESYTCGVPIITTDVSDIREYIQYSENSVLLKDDTVESIQNAMLGVLQNKTIGKASDLKKTFHYDEYRESVEKWLYD